ncbi:MAG: hypothetical protein HKN82_05430, partial [Akkermansiaceae bacterium]|nr:hypothetical protein [Akkermansiaceae bacterium]
HQSFLHLRGPHGPIAFTGPAKVCLKTTGLVSIQVVQTHSEPVRPHSAPSPATKAALWQSLASR